MPDVLWPLFCTAELPLPILNELLETTRNEDPDIRDVVRILGPDDAGPTASSTTDISKPTVPPLSAQPPDNFAGWSIDDIYAFWKQYVRAKDDVVDNRYTAFTFLVADEQTAKDKTVFVCTDAPDWGEGENDVVLKKLRMSLKDAAIDMASFEYLSMTPKEWGKGKGLITDPNPWMKVVGYTDNNEEILRFGTPAFARQRKRAALVDASQNGTVDMTRYMEEGNPRFNNLEEAVA
ncbi:MAG: hypothetical protein Q9165_001408 [Trypethelium subeluteriae]